MAATLCMGSLLLPYHVQAQKSPGKDKQHPAAKSPKKSNSQASIGVGRTLFVKNCSPCHGANGQGGEGPNLQKMTLTEATIGTTIKSGVAGEMPAFGSKFKDADIKALAAFIHSIEK